MIKSTGLRNFQKRCIKKTRKKAVKIYTILQEEISEFTELDFREISGKIMVAASSNLDFSSATIR